MNDFSWNFVKMMKEEVKVKEVKEVKGKEVKE